jgi:hypothetical protein
VQDAFYRTLKSKLWQLAREIEGLQGTEGAEGEGDGGLEAPSPGQDGRVGVVFQMDEELDADDKRRAGNGDVDTDTSDNEGSDDTVRRRSVVPRSMGSSGNGGQENEGGALEGGALLARRRSHPAYVEEHENSDGSDDSLCGSDVDELVDWVRAKPAMVRLTRRRSEGRGRQRARERAERARERWLKGPD